MTDSKSAPRISPENTTPATSTTGTEVDAFLAKMRGVSTQPAANGGRLIFALDATASRQRPLGHQPPPREELVRGNAMAASHQAYRHARLERLLDDPNLFRRCPAPTALNRCDDFNSICRIGHRHGCMPHTCQVGDRVRSVRGLSHTRRWPNEATNP